MDSKLLGAPAEIPGFLSEHWDGSCRSKSLISPDYGVRGPGGGRGPMPVTPHDSAGAPSIFSGLELKWGLRLMPQKGPVDVLLIDQVERPSAN